MPKQKRRYKHTCTRCGHNWLSHKRKPERCANRVCGSAYWNKPRVPGTTHGRPEPELDETRAWDLKAKEQRTCQVHGLPLEPGLARIDYGLIGVDKEYYADKRDLFPHSNSWILGGCVSSNVEVAEVDCCPNCREAEEVWFQMKKLLSTLEAA